MRASGLVRVAALSAILAVVVLTIGFGHSATATAACVSGVKSGAVPSAVCHPAPHCALGLGTLNSNPGRKIFGTTTWTCDQYTDFVSYNYWINGVPVRISQQGPPDGFASGYGPCNASKNQSAHLELSAFGPGGGFYMVRDTFRTVACIN